MEESIRTELDEIQEELRALREAADQSELAVLALDRIINNVVLPALPREGAIDSAQWMTRQIEEWKLMKRPLTGPVGQLLREAEGTLYAIAGVTDHEGLVAARRRALRVVPPSNPDRT